MMFQETMLNTSDAKSVEQHLCECDSKFIPPLSERVNLSEYSIKLAEHADRFEFWDKTRLVGLVAAYLNALDHQVGFISSVSVCADFEGRGIGSILLKNCFEQARQKGFQILNLEVGAANTKAIDFYLKQGFAVIDTLQSGFLCMQFKIIKQ